MNVSCRFPKNLELQQKWMEVTGVSKITCNSCVCTCSDHFEPESFHNTDGYTFIKRLIKNAVPSLALSHKWLNKCISFSNVNIKSPKIVCDISNKCTSNTSSDILSHQYDSTVSLDNLNECCLSELPSNVKEVPNKCKNDSVTLPDTCFISTLDNQVGISKITNVTSDCSFTSALRDCTNVLNISCSSTETLNINFQENHQVTHKQVINNEISHARLNNSTIRTKKDLDKNSNIKADNQISNTKITNNIYTNCNFFDLSIEANNSTASSLCADFSQDNASSNSRSEINFHPNLNKKFKSLNEIENNSEIHSNAVPTTHFNTLIEKENTGISETADDSTND